VATDLTLADRLRIERAVRRFDTLLYDLPTRVRKAAREELRANLLAASGEHGAAAAVRQLGDLRELAEGYLDAEYGSAKRPQWRKGVFWAVAVEVLIVVPSVVGFVSFMDGAGAAASTGTYHWGGWLGFWGPTGDVTLENGEFREFVFEAPFSFFFFPAFAFLIGSRVWRSLPPWWRHRRTHRAQARQA
jgi:hypothetical protein